jgi:hypothetical protein
MEIKFTGRTAPVLNGISFQALVDGNNTPCEVSVEALQDHFQASRQRSLHDAFEYGRSHIEDAARRLIESGMEPPIIVGTHDIR